MNRGSAPIHCLLFLLIVASDTAFERIQFPSSPNHIRFYPSTDKEQGNVLMENGILSDVTVICSN